MSCNESDRSPDGFPDGFPDGSVERSVELPAPPEVVWEELPGMLGDDVELHAEPGGALRAHGPDGDRVGVVDEAVRGERLTFRWMRTDGDAPASEVEFTLEPSGLGTLLHLRETLLDGSHLVRSAFLALARA